jgi:thiosulfate/3-mercaptopyruvate sulfurtransferase
MTHSGSKGYANPHLLITADELAARLDEDPPLVIDLRPAEIFAAGHVPGAIHLDLWAVSLSNTDEAPLRSFFWTIEHVLASRGVRADRPIVVYDEQSGLRAARAFWFFEYFGHADVRVLDGGYGAWISRRHPIAREATPPRSSDWHGARHAHRLATWIDVHGRLGDPRAVIVDTRSDEEYLGTVARATRGGAIQGAVHVEWTRNLDVNGEFKNAAALRGMYESAGVTPDKEVITYCQGGYRAAHTYLALRLLGYPNVRNYIGSWQEWGNREDLPLERPTKP